jgi:hypothetical protein
LARAIPSLVFPTPVGPMIAMMDLRAILSNGLDEEELSDISLW